MQPDNNVERIEKINNAIEKIMIASGFIGMSWFLTIALVGMYIKL